jgi:hypothetical protein
MLLLLASLAPLLAAQPRARSGGAPALRLSLDRGPGTPYREGEAIRVTVESERDCCLQLVYVDAAGGRTRIFPNRYSDPAGRVRGGTPVVLGGEDSEFALEVAAPFGAELIRAYASDKPLPAPAGKPGDGGALALDASVDGVDLFFEEAAERAHARLAASTLLLRTEAQAPREAFTPGRNDTVAVGDRPRMFALVIGVSRYRSAAVKPLQFAASDAKLMAGFLGSDSGAGIPPEQMLVLLDEQATRENILTGVRDFLGRTRRDDIVFVYFAGHGCTSSLRGATYFFCHDTDPADLQAGAVDQAELTARLNEDVRAGKLILFLDACHGGGLGLGGVRQRGWGTPVSSRLLTELASKKNGTVFLTASRAMERSKEGTQWGGGHGAFTWHLVEGLRGKADRDGDRRVTIDELAEYVLERVRADTRGEQHPELKGYFENDLVLSVR